MTNHTSPSSSRRPHRRGNEHPPIESRFVGRAFEVKSQSEPGQTHLVIIGDDWQSCTCKGYVETLHCYHIEQQVMLNADALRRAREQELHAHNNQP